MSKIAVIETGGKQYRVEEGKILRIEKIKGNKGDAVAFEKILLLGDSNGEAIEVGTPYISDKKVKATILDQGRAKKVLVTKYKNKTRYKVRTGHKQPYTQVKITSI